MEHFGNWLAFGALVLALLTLDQLVFHRNQRAPSLRESAGWTLFWVALAAIFNVVLWRWRSASAGPQAGGQAGIEFLTGYLLEWSLSMDNVFVFAVIFRFFGVPLKYQYRVLFWGILGAVVLRLTFILAGATLVARFAWVMPLFGAFLVYTAFRLLGHDESDVDPEQNWLLRLARRFLPVARGEHGHGFFVREDGRRCVTPLFLVLLVIESTDVLFAVDSVPAIFGITRDPFVVFSSNIFAILGLRALYFLLAGVMDKFRYLHYGLASVLAFIGLKMIAAAVLPLRYPGFALEHWLPAWTSLVVVVGLLGIAVVASLLAGKKEERGE